MKRSISLIAAFIVGLSAVLSAAPIANVQFTDTKGKKYDLYALLAEGKSVLVHTSGTH